MQEPQEPTEVQSDVELDRRTIPQRVLTTRQPAPLPRERMGYFALGFVLLGCGAFSLRHALRKSSSAHHALSSRSFETVPELQRTITIRASMAEVELFFTDPPKLQNCELGRDLHLQLTMRPGPAGGGTELQGRLARWPSNLKAEEADLLLRDVLRAAKQLIEAGEVAVSS